jgi:hypothetical protein
MMKSIDTAIGTVDNYHGSVDVALHSEAPSYAHPPLIIIFKASISSFDRAYHLMVTHLRRDPMYGTMLP